MSAWSSRRSLLLGGIVILGAVMGLAASRLSFGGGGATTNTQVAGEPASPTATETAQASLTLPSTPVTQWGELQFSVEGFQPGETVILQDGEGDAAKEIGKAEADGQGQVKDGTVQLPSWLESGHHPIQAVGTSSGTRVSEELLVRAKTLWVNLNDHSPPQGGRLGFVAGGFEPDDQVKAYLTRETDAAKLAAQQPLADVKADEVGNTPWTEVEVPTLEPGKYILLLKGDNSQGQVAEELSVAPLQLELELSPWSGPPGRQVNLNARGFLPEEQVDLFLGGNDRPVFTYQADQYGGLWGAGPIAIPSPSNGGPLTFRLRGQNSGSEVTRDFGVMAPNPWVELSNYSGPGGTPVVARGGGFASGERVTLHLGNAGAPTLGQAVSNEDGYYEGLGPAQVPADAEREVTFVVVGDTTGAQGQAVFKVVQPYVPELPQLRP